MRILAIDTSHAEGSVAAFDGERLVEVRFAPARSHARRIAAALAEAAAALGWEVRDAELLAVVRGPGSFTGLRVGIAAAKGIAWAGGTDVASVSGFELVAEAWSDATAPTAIQVAFDAGRGELFAAAVAPDAASPTGWRAGAGRLVEARRWVEDLPVGARISGPALDIGAVAEPLATRPDLAAAPAPLRHPSAAGAARFGARLAAAGATIPAAELLPDYTRPSYAQENDPRPTG